MFLRRIRDFRRTVTNAHHFGLVEMAFRLIHASCSLPTRKAVIVTFFAPCDWKKFPCMHQSLMISLVAVNFAIDLFHKGSLLVYNVFFYMYDN